MSGDDFYVGYLPRMPKTLARFVAPAVAALLLVVAALAYAVPALHDASAFARSDFREIRDFDGLLLATPVPHLVMVRPGDTAERELSRYFLVGRGKSGPKIDVDALSGKQVRVRGSLIYRDAQTLISVKSAEELPPAEEGAIGDDASAGLLGTFTLQGEIVDSKCFLGTMRPGETKVHRGCAVRCISGGIPPMLLARDRNGNTLSFLLVASDGSAVNERILDLVAQPVEITGEVERLGDLFILKANPETYRRL